MRARDMQRKNIARVLLLACGGLALTGAYYGTLRLKGAARQPVLAVPAVPTSGAGGQATIYFVENPEPAPAFQARDLTGKVVSTADWKGKAVLLNFWATWCPPCRVEIPILIALQRKYEGRLLIIGVSEDDGSPEEVLKFANSAGINYPVVMATPELLAAWGGVAALPTTFLINPEGRVLQRHRGLRSFDQYDLEVRALLGMAVDARIETIANVGQVLRKNAANTGELPDVDFTGLTAEQKQHALNQMNATTCTCGCKLTLAQCRLDDPACATSRSLTAQIVKEVAAGETAAPAIPTIANNPISR